MKNKELLEKFEQLIMFYNAHHRMSNNRAAAHAKTEIDTLRRDILSRMGEDKIEQENINRAMANWRINDADTTVV